MFTRNKTTKIILVLAVIAIIATALLIFPSDQSPKIAELDSVSAQDLQTQSYVANSVLEVKDGDNILGNKNAQLKIFVYEDYANRYSAELAVTLKKIARENRNEVSIIVRPYVTVSSLLSQQAALAMSCSDSKWSKMRDELFNAVEDNMLSANNFSEYADGVGLNEEKFLTCFQDAEELLKISKVVQETKSYSVLGAPTIFIDDEMILGARPYNDYLDSNGDSIEGLKTIIERKLK